VSESVDNQPPAPPEVPPRTGSPLPYDEDAWMGFMGNYMHRVDPQKRIGFPNDWYIAPYIKYYLVEWVIPADNDPEGCYTILKGFPPERYRQIHESFRDAPLGDTKINRERRLSLGAAHQVVLDKARRIMLGTGLAEDLGLGEQVRFVGMGDHFEVWRQEDYKKNRSGDPKTRLAHYSGIK
jgi:DNA-binding transcriptional regulator/RsmH inhibitor MraZ